MAGVSVTFISREPLEQAQHDIQQQRKAIKELTDTSESLRRQVRTLSGQIDELKKALVVIVNEVDFHEHELADISDVETATLLPRVEQAAERLDELDFRCDESNGRLQRARATGPTARRPGRHARPPPARHPGAVPARGAGAAVAAADRLVAEGLAPAVVRSDGHDQQRVPARHRPPARRVAAVRRRRARSGPAARAHPGTRRRRRALAGHRLRAGGHRARGVRRRAVPVDRAGRSRRSARDDGTPSPRWSVCPAPPTRSRWPGSCGTSTVGRRRCSSSW